VVKSLKSDKLNAYLEIKKEKSKVSLYITKILLSAIFLFLSLIYTSKDEKNAILFRESVFENSLNFMDFNNFYQKYLVRKPKGEQMVNSTIFDFEKIEDLEMGQKLTFSQRSVIKTLSSGIVVYTGEKENFGNTVIIQGSDGYDIWYGNLENVGVSLYDFVDKDAILADVENELYLVIKNDEKYLKYEEYQSKV